MLGAKGFSVLAVLLLALIALQHASAATVVPPKVVQQPATPQASATKAKTAEADERYSGPGYGAYDGPGYGEGRPGADYGRSGKQDQSYGEQRHEGPHSSYDEAEGKHGARDDYHNKDSYDSYEGPKQDSYSKPAPCPKAMTADFVENVLIGKAKFTWTDLVEETKKTSRRGRRSRHGADAKTAAADDTKAATASSTATASKDSKPAAAAAVGVASVGTAAANAGTAGAAGNPTAKTTAAKPAGGYGLTDTNFLLPVGPDVGGVGFPGSFDNTMSPSSEALAVGPHVGPNANPTFVTLLHAINAQAEIRYASKKSGNDVTSSKDSGKKVKLQDIAAQIKELQPDINNHLFMADPSAFFDVKEERWVLAFTSHATTTGSWTPVVFITVSHTIDPLGEWTVYALEARPQVCVGYQFAAAGGAGFSPMAPQISYSHDGIFLSIGASFKKDDNAEAAILSVLFAYSKAALYDCDTPDEDTKIYAATYLGSSAWKSSISYKEQCLIKEDYRTFNNLITPARPQSVEDVMEAPLFVMKVDGAYMSVATLTDDPLDKMTSINNAPSIRAIVIGKGEDFSNKEGLPDGAAIMPQPDTDVLLDSGDTGMLGGKYGIRAYGTVHHKGLLYTTFSEFFGSHDMRVPSIYWAIIATHPGSGLCKAARKKWGFIASQDGLALAYPVIAARDDGTAVVVYSFAGNVELDHSLGFAHPGVASTLVGLKDDYGEEVSSIDITKLGEGSIEYCDNDGNGEADELCRWGDYSAAQVYEGNMWYAVPYAEWGEQYRSWIGVIKC